MKLFRWDNVTTISDKIRKSLLSPCFTTGKNSLCLSPIYDNIFLESQKYLYIAKTSGSIFSNSATVMNVSYSTEKNRPFGPIVYPIQNSMLSITGHSRQCGMASFELPSWRPLAKSEGDKVIFTVYRGRKNMSFLNGLSTWILKTCHIPAFSWL